MAEENSSWAIDINNITYHWGKVNFFKINNKIKI